MLLSSQAFLLMFLPLALAAFYLLASTPGARVLTLLASSLVFYGWWDVRFVPLLLATGAVNWLAARAYAGTQKSAIIGAGIAFNLLLLGVFKYSNFLVGSALALFGQAFTPWDIVLPLGVSFYTFQQVSYLIDVRRGQARVYGINEFACYVCFFPHLIAGPIIRHHELIPQFARLTSGAVDYPRCARGLVLFILGLAKKVWLADQLAPIADQGFALASPGAAAAWQAALAYSLQLYFDFSGYSDMALGLAGLFGLELPVNFDAPYRATSIREFWRRWHMTLSRFLRDYLYIPLGGSRHGRWRSYRASVLTMLLCGLWHGAGWTFIAWGGLHGLAVCANRFWLTFGRPLPAVLGWSVTMLFVIVGWVLFRAEHFDVALHMLRGMVGAGVPAVVPGADWLRIAVAAALAVFGPTNLALSKHRWTLRAAVAMPLAVLLVATTLRVGQGRGLDFIYFQF